LGEKQSSTFAKLFLWAHKILVEDGVIPPNAVPFGEDKNGSTLFIARALLEVGIIFSLQL